MPIWTMAARSAPAAVRAFSTTASRASIRSKLWSSRIVRYPVYGASALVFSTVTVIGGLLIYDSMTYHSVCVGDGTMSKMSSDLRGGPNNRPIHPHAPGKEGRPRLVIVGGGWGAVSVLNRLDASEYDVVLISPTNYFCFTPMLPALAAGTVGPGSITESLRSILTQRGGRFVQGAALSIVPNEQLRSSTRAVSEEPSGLLEVEVISPEWDGNMDVEHRTNENSVIYVPYDKLIIAVGSVSNSSGVQGLEHCHRLKSINNALGLRKQVIENLEIASMPTISDEDRRRLLSFVVCGGGPTGVEVAAELSDLLSEDAHKNFPVGLSQYARVHLIQDRNHILNTYSESISEFAERHFEQHNVNVITNALVKKVTEDEVQYLLRGEDKDEMVSLPSGCTVWSAGITMAPFTRLLSQTLPNQGHPHALRVDSHLRVLGTEPGTVYAIGDASTVDRDLRKFMEENFSRFDVDQDGRLTMSEFSQMVRTMRHKFPMSSDHLKHIDRLFIQYDTDHDNYICADYFMKLVMDATKNLTAYPPTAQIAAQEGNYLAKKLNHLARLRASGSLPAEGDVDDLSYKPFHFHSLGSIAYLGNAAAFDLPLPGPFKTFFGGLFAMYAWRSVYLSELVSFRTRALVLGDFIKRSLWGRDLAYTG